MKSITRSRTVGGLKFYWSKIGQVNSFSTGIFIRTILLTIVKTFPVRNKSLFQVIDEMIVKFKERSSTKQGISLNLL